MQKKGSGQAGRTADGGLMDRRREALRGIGMPRREDERRLNLSGRHPEACTCKDCTDRFLKKKGLKAGKPSKTKPRAGETVKRHPADCQCASCGLLKSVGLAQEGDPPKAGFFKRLLGKR